MTKESYMTSVLRILECHCPSCFSEIFVDEIDPSCEVQKCRECGEKFGLLVGHEGREPVPEKIFNAISKSVDGAIN